MRTVLLVFFMLLLSACSTPRLVEGGITKKSAPCLTVGTDLETARACLAKKNITLHDISPTWSRYSKCRPWLFLPLLPACGGLEITSSAEGKVLYWKSWSELDAL